MIAWLLAVATLISGPVLAADQRTELPISVEFAGAIGSANQPILKAQLTNRGHEKISVETASLPWGNRYSITLLAVGENARYEQPLPLVFPIDDPLPGEVDIKPGETIVGTIRLDYVFKEIQSRLQRGPVLVLWSYRLETVDGRRSPRLGGYIRVARAPPSGSHRQ